jgi:hypothetical protein
MEYLIRRAEVADAPGACEAVRQSIAELCIEDHHGDQAMIAAWLSNKTIEHVASWIASPRNIAAVAQAAIDLVGFELLSQARSPSYTCRPGTLPWGQQRLDGVPRKRGESLWAFVRSG